MKIILKGITKNYGSKTVIKPLDLTINSGSFTTLLGPSGCGKTTLLRMISGLETPDGGEIYFDDRLIFSSEKGVDIPPEAASDVPMENSVKFDTVVRSVQFLGGLYQITLDFCGEHWIYLSSRRMSVGNTLPIYISKNNIITV